MADMKWISVKKQKPPLNTRILLFIRYKYEPIIYIGEYLIPPGYKKRAVFATNVTRYKDGSIDNGFPLKYVTHWMPLPEWPKFRKPRR
jgi:hypothetical protein